MTTQARSRDDGAVTGVTREHPATWAWVAVVVAGLDAIALGVSFVVAAGTEALNGINESSAWINIVAAPTFPLLAALMLRSRGRDPHRPPRQDRLAWTFLGFGVLCTATITLHVFADYGLRNSTPFAIGLAWVSSWLWTGVPTGLLLALLWFPTGDVPGPRWRWAVRGDAVAYAFITLAVAFTPGPITDFDPHPRNPLGWQAADAPLHVIGSVGFFLLALVAITTVVSVVWRFRRGDAAIRSQLRWLLIAVGIIAVTIAVPVPPALDGAMLALNIVAILLLPVTLAVALVRRDGLALPRILVYGLLSASLLAAYIGVVAVADVLFGGRSDRAATLVAAGVVVVVAAPVRTRLQRAVDRLVYGDRGNPYAALSDLGRRIAGSPDDLLHEVLGAVTDALRTGYAAVVLAGDDEPTASVGITKGPQVVVPLTLRGENIGSLVVAQRGPGAEFSRHDRALLEDLARHISVAAHAAALTRDLQRSRESLVLAREEERRRIRRDLHDGLGPALAGVAFGIDAARSTVTRDPETAAAVLADLRSEVQASIADVRRLVYDLRPPALDQLGLVPALEQYAARLAERGALDVSVSAPEMPPLPAAVEVAAYRIATEALTNVARHSRARSSLVSLVIGDGVLRLEVADDGIGVPATRAERNGGVGLPAMAERAAELGGACSIDARPGGGTAVVAILPLKAAS